MSLLKRDQPWGCFQNALTSANVTVTFRCGWIDPNLLPDSVPKGRLKFKAVQISETTGFLASNLLIALERARPDKIRLFLLTGCCLTGSWGFRICVRSKRKPQISPPGSPRISCRTCWLRPSSCVDAASSAWHEIRVRSGRDDNFV
jgi:hypothetical protein